ncbi:MAG TPA: LPS assembly lipoprotein LptE [Patescibacteria group bacterium]|nr:LPS assembly lipoprotein LptE [Patescibacteria group bacterium]
MSWSKRLVPLFLLLSLTACGFRPLYGTKSVDPGTVAELASVSIRPLDDRQGQMIHNALLTRFNPRGEPLKPRYDLWVTYTVSEGQSALRTDDTATRNTLFFAVTYRLLEKGVAIVIGNVTKQVSYDFLTQHYADVSADEDMRRRASEMLAEEVRNRIAAYFIRNAEMKAETAKKAAATKTPATGATQ